MKTKLLACAAILFSTLLVCSCETKSDREQNEKASGETLLNRSVFKLLQGRWKSKDDPKAVIEFKDHYYRDFYDEKQLEESVFTLGISCDAKPSEQSGSSAEDTYLMANDQCWHINTIDDTVLEMTYSLRGNTLRYEKIK